MKNAKTPKDSTIRIKGGVAATLVVLALAGCASTTPKLDAKFGDSLQKAKEAQQIQPTAAQRKTAAPNATSAEVQRAVTIQSLGLPQGAVGGAAPAQTTGTTTGTTTTTR